MARAKKHHSSHTDSHPDSHSVENHSAESHLKEEKALEISEEVLAETAAESDIADLAPEVDAHTESHVVPESERESTPQSRTAATKGRTRLYGAAALALFLVVGGLYTYGYFTSAEYAAKQIEKKNAALIKEVATHMLLPENEKPVIYTVQDPALLSAQQPFFKGAEAGDSLIVFPQSAKAIIYSKSRGLIVTVGPVSFDQSALQMSQ